MSCILMISDSHLEVMVQSLPEVREAMAQAGKCLVCDGPFINSWLECVKFIQAKKVSNIIITLFFICT